MDIPAQLTGEMPHITVSLSNAYGREWKGLRCSICGNIVCQYNEKYIRTITASGEPQIDKPGKIVQCTGVMPLYGAENKEVFALLFEMLDTVLNQSNISNIRDIALALAKESQEKHNIRCKARYYLA